MRSLTHGAGREVGWTHVGVVGLSQRRTEAASETVSPFNAANRRLAPSGASARVLTTSEWQSINQSINPSPFPVRADPDFNAGWDQEHFAALSHHQHATLLDGGPELEAS